MTDYIVVSANTTGDIAKRVKVESEKGYIPIGGVSVTYNHQVNTHMFFQAMIKN